MAMATERLGQRVEALGDMLSVLGRLTDEAGTLLDVLGGSLGQLGALTAPIHSRATALTAAQRNVAATKAEVDSLLDHLDTARRVAGPLAAGPASDLAAFMEALESLERSVAFLQGHARLAAVQAALGHAQALFNRALETCHADFTRTLVEATRAAMPPPAWVQQHLDDVITEATREHLTRSLVAPDVLLKLQRMGQVMLDAAYSPVRDSYAAARDRGLEVALRAVGQETPPLASLQLLQPDALERVIAAWTRRLQALVLLSLSEYRLARAVWPENVGDELFSRVVGRHLQQLAQSGRDIIEARRVPEKLFALLDMHSLLQQVVPSLLVVLAGPPRGDDEHSATHEDGGGCSSSGGGAVAQRQLSPACMALLREFSALVALVARAAAVLFGEYEDVVARDASKILPPDGTIHPLTAQVLSYLKRLLTYERAAEVLFGGDDVGSIRSSGGGSNAEGSTAAALAAAVSRLMARLLDNLESKSRQYRGDAALGALFMMNNVHYVQWSVEGSAAEALLGRDWLERHKDLVEDWGARYQDLTWGPLLALLQVDAPTDVGRLKQHLKDTFSTFNAGLERIYATQSCWTIPDAMLRDAVKRVVKNDVMQPYQEFLRRYADVQFTTTPAKYIKFTAGDIQTIVDDDLFSGKVR
ncbi:Exocyst complex component 7 [Monoraphidium neglectum]|uniref:Exocyst subunit Exo70 family protein n=1 Tax=Monoraphidium neglectum TaxID=145388 RepID=A0A0D2MN77_9CHLO|nr:Exocyst complex component 7 [Monoraphidium neglectum]KIZ02022.1 Exocyst complex component 7 [Monoraphidium neglectum]|eukprot:XP_013901041.1 Exocyst complex component 7 [Monoraphidium neglectum]